MEKLLSYVTKHSTDRHSRDLIPTKSSSPSACRKDVYSSCYKFVDLYAIFAELFNTKADDWNLHWIRVGIHTENKPLLNSIKRKVQAMNLSLALWMKMKRTSLQTRASWLLFLLSVFASYYLRTDRQSKSYRVLHGDWFAVRKPTNVCQNMYPAIRAFLNLLTR